MIIWRPYRSYSSGSSGNPSTTVLLEDEASWRTCMAGVIYGESWTNAHNFQLSERADRHELSPRGDVANSAQLVTVASRTKNSDNEQQQRTTEHLRIANSSPYLPSIKKVIGASITENGYYFIVQANGSQSSRYPKSTFCCRSRFQSVDSYLKFLG